MAVVGILLLALGLGDLARSRDLSRPAPAYGVGVGAVVVFALLAELHTWRDIVLLAVAAATCVAWSLLTARTLRSGGGERIALAALGLGLLVQLVCTGAVSPADGLLGSWLESSDLAAVTSIGADRLLLIVGVFAVQLTTGNLFVRLVLSVIGSIRPEGEPQAADQLKGGRLLGPMERVFILGLGVAGAPTAAALVIAAKGLIRFPELNTRRTAGVQIKGVGIDEVTEYFLVGSFVSWLVALSALGLLAIS